MLAQIRVTVRSLAQRNNTHINNMSSHVPVALSSSSSSSAHGSSILASKSDATWRPLVPVGHTAYTWGQERHAMHSHAHSSHNQHHHHHKAAHAQGGKPQHAEAKPVKADGEKSDLKKKAAAATPAAAAPANANNKKKPAKAAASASSSSSSAASSSVPSRSVLLHPQFAKVELIDIGANLLDGMFSGHYHGGKAKHPEDLGAILKRAKDRGCKRVIVTAGNKKESAEAQRLVEKWRSDKDADSIPQLTTTVGVHPTRSKEWNGTAQHQEAYYQALLSTIHKGLESKPRTVVAIGECGLDYDRLFFSDKESQLAHFEKHFKLVESVKASHHIDLPLFLHDRNTEGDFARILRENRQRFKNGVVHSFTGTIEELKQHLALDLYIGINGCSLKTAENLQALNHIPLNRLLLETDAPWCDIKNTHASAPLVSTKFDVVNKPESWVEGMGVKGRNEPGNMVQVLEVVSMHLGMDAVELAEIVRQNTLRVFFPEEVSDAAPKQ